MMSDARKKSGWPRKEYVDIDGLRKRVCVRCKLARLIEEFLPKKNPDGKQYSYCIQCRKEMHREYWLEHKDVEMKRTRDWMKNNPERAREIRSRTKEKRKLHDRSAKLKRDHGITHEEYVILYERQGGKCAICRVSQTSYLHVDHCHKEDRIRGLLCGSCNRAIGLLRDDPYLCLMASEYLEKR